VTLSSFLIELSFISSSARFRDSAFCSDDTDFDGRHGVVSWIGDKFFPNEADGFVFKSPGFENVYGDIELWTGCPHVAYTVFGRDVFNVHIAEFIWFHSWVVVRCRAGVIHSFIGKVSSIVVPRRVTVDDVELLWWFIGVLELFLCVW